MTFFPEKPFFRAVLPQTLLPRARPPRWMRRSITAASLLLLLLSAGLLFVPGEEAVRTTGRLYHGGAVSLFAPRAAFVSSVPPPAGSQTAKDQLLLTLSDPDLQERKASVEAEEAAARAALAAEEARLRRALAAPLPPEFLFSGFDVERHSEVAALQQDFLKRLETIERSGAASQAEVLNLRLQLITSETLLRRSRLARDLLTGDYGGAVKEEARRRVEEARHRLDAITARKNHLEAQTAALEIRAPIAGILTASTRRDPGERVEAGEPLFEIAPDGVNRIRLTAPARQLHLIRPGLPVRFRAASETDPLAPPGQAVVLAVRRAPSAGASSAGSPPPPGEMPPSTVIDAEVLSAPSDLLPDVPVSAEIVLGSRPLWRLFLSI